MLLMIVGVAVGIITGSLFLGDHGWSVGALIGGLTGVVLQQIQRINSLESSVKALGEEQQKNQTLLHALKNDLQEKSAPEPTPRPVEEIKQVQNKTAEALSSTAAISNPIRITATTVETIELELPEDYRSVSSQPVHIIAPPVKPHEPGIVDKIFNAVHRFFTEGNPIVRIGMVIMFFGISFLVKYAATQGLLPIEFRLTGILLVAIALLTAGWKTRLRPGSYGLVLQGGGVAIIYLTLFAAAKLYGLIPLGIAFGLLFFIVILGVLLALLQNTQILAILATAGGFLAPILTSSGEGNHVALFSFYLILNLGILAIALYKTWRLLNWVGFMFTFVITATWGVLKYEPGFYASTQPFLIAFFALYLTVSLLFSFKQPTNLKGIVDGSLIFGLPLVAFGLQTKLLNHTDYGLAISSLVLSATYIGLSLGLSRRHLQNHRVLIESFLALGISFATLTIPLALDASWTAVTWALEASGLIWVGLRQQRFRARAAGYLLHIAAAVSLIIVDGLDTGITPVISGDFLALTLLALTAFSIAYLMDYFKDAIFNIEKLVAPIAIAFGIIWWFVAGINEINAHVQAQNMFAGIILFAALSAATCMLASKKLAWALLNKSVYFLLPFMVLLFLTLFSINSNEYHPSQGFALLAIAIFFTIQYRYLFNEGKAALQGITFIIRTWHILTAWCLFSLIFWETSWQTAHLGLANSSTLIVWFAAILAPLALLMVTVQRKFWPFVALGSDYKNWIPAPLFIFATLWFINACGNIVAAPEKYLPLLNPLDITQFAVILIFAYAVKQKFMDSLAFISNQARTGFLAGMLFVWLNVVTIRAVSHYQSIPYDADFLWDAIQVQMALSILWTMCALIVMNLSRRIQSRSLWKLGAGLLGIVILKLATKDFSGSSTLAGIISFVAVGALMLLIGFLSPIPATSSESNAPDQADTEAKKGVLND